MKKIGLFGGSFDPIHKGHIEIAKHAIEQLQLDEVQFIPTKNNPWKNQSCANAKERLHMIHIAIEGYPKLSVNTIELENKNDEKNYTIHTLKKITKQNPDIQKYYQAYYQLNDMLEEVTEIVFQNISSDLKQDRWKI